MQNPHNCLGQRSPLSCNMEIAIFFRYYRGTSLSYGWMLAWNEAIFLWWSIVEVYDPIGILWSFMAQGNTWYSKIIIYNFKTYVKSQNILFCITSKCIFGGGQLHLSKSAILCYYIGCYICLKLHIMISQNIMSIRFDFKKIFCCSFLKMLLWC